MTSLPAMPRLQGTRYVVPLREGGSLPAVVETDRGGPYVVKFRGAGQGPRALVAEAIVAGLARALGLPVPRPAVVALDAAFGRSEPDPEIQDVLRGSVGPNFGLAYLPGALAFDPAADAAAIGPEFAADVVWLDAYLTNVDRSPRNANLLLWQGQVWLIDHGAALFFHHRWPGWRQRIQAPFPQVREHVLLAQAGDLRAAHARLVPRLDETTIRELVADVPDEWLGDEPEFPDLAAHRDAYVTYLTERLRPPAAWLDEAVEARARGPARLAPRLTHRVV
jgi:hypothetical protein